MIISLIFIILAALSGLRQENVWICLIFSIAAVISYIFDLSTDLTREKIENYKNAYLELSKKDIGFECPEKLDQDYLKEGDCKK